MQLLKHMGVGRENDKSIFVPLTRESQEQRSAASGFGSIILAHSLMLFPYELWKINGAMRSATSVHWSPLANARSHQMDWSVNKVGHRNVLRGVT